MTNENSDTTAPVAAEHVITVTRGNPNAEEIAAVTVLLAALTPAAAESEQSVRRGWARPSRGFNRATVPGAGWGRR